MLMLQPSLRGYGRDDLAAMAALDAVCFTQEFVFDEGALRRFAEASNAEVVVAEAADGALVGFVIVHIEGVDSRRRAYVVTLDVAPAYRRAGVAGRLMETVEDRAAAAGIAGMELHVYTENEAAIRFYEAHGYVRTGSRRGFYGPGLDALTYRKGMTIAR